VDSRWRNQPPQGPSIWENDAEIDSLIANHYDRYRQTGLDLHLGLYIDLFLSSELDAQGRPPGDPSYVVPYSDSMVLGCPEEDPTAIPCNPDSLAPYYPPAHLLYFGLPVGIYYPTTTNSWVPS